MVYAIIAAGGIGSRFGADKPKQLTMLNGKSILWCTTKVFERVDRVSKIIVACPAEWLKECEKELEGIEKVCVTVGGKTRNETVMNAIDYIEENFGADEDTIVVTHDAVRPFVTDTMILESIDAAEKYGASVAAVAAVDTIIECKDGFIEHIPDRRKMFQVQTPQTFKALKLKELYSNLSEEEKETLTDCSKIFVLSGEKVAVIPGDRENIKITYKLDVRC